MINTVERNQKYDILLDKVNIVGEEAIRITTYMREELLSQQKIELHVLKYNQNIGYLDNYQKVEDQMYEMANQLHQSIEQVFDLANADNVRINLFDQNQMNQSVASAKLMD